MKGTEWKKIPTNGVRVNIPEIVFTPMQLAEMEIIELTLLPELQRNFMIGGKTPSEMIEEDKRRHAEFMRRRAAIIAKHGLTDTYLHDLLDQEHTLSEKLAQLQEERKVLEAARVE